MSILRTLFGPSKQEIWQQFCAQTGAHLTAGGFWDNVKAEASHGQWTITLDTYAVSYGKGSTTYTRMRAPYINPDGFQFDIYRKGIFSDIGKWFGRQDVTVGLPEFDEAFVILANDGGRLRKLLPIENRNLISAQPDIHFGVVDDNGTFGSDRGFPKDVNELHFQVVGVIKDVDRLKLLYDLFSETLDELGRIGSAYENAPNVKL